MNIIDIIILICIAASAIWGFADGVIRQLGTLVGIIIGIILANTFAQPVSSILGINGDNATVIGYIIVLVLSLIGVSFLTITLRKIISIVGLGIIDRLAGAILGVIKTTLIMSLLFSIFHFLNPTLNFVDNKVVSQSQFYKPILSCSQYIMPAIHWVEEQLPLEKQQDDE